LFDKFRFTFLKAVRNDAQEAFALCKFPQELLEKRATKVFLLGCVPIYGFHDFFQDLDTGIAAELLGEFVQFLADDLEDTFLAKILNQTFDLGGDRGI
jgi:hypothetical protein